MARDKGLLIAFEGIDGAGKTTQVGRLAEFFRTAEIPVAVSKEPTDGPWGQKIRKSASNGRMSLAEELHAFNEDRREHVANVIRPAIDAGKCVILDRYFYSTIAYQGSRGGDADAIEQNQIGTWLVPDAVILVDVPPEVGLSRVEEGRGEKPNAFEKLSTLRACRTIFLDLERKHANIIHIDGTQGIDSVRKAVMRSLIDGILKKRYCAKEYGCDGLMCSYRMSGTCTWAKMAGLAGL